MICSLSDGHTLMGCPYRCQFCGVSVNNCECHDSSIVSSVLALETPEKEGRRTETSTSTQAAMRNVKEVEMTGKQTIPNNRFRLQIVYAVKYMDYWRKNIDSYGRRARFKIEIYQYVEL